jgi:CheY-like chemotaxis protein
MSLGEGLTVLVTDDSKLSRDALKKMLVRAGFKVDHFVEASNGEEALEVLLTQTIDLLFLDLHMPVLNGERVLDSMAENPTLCEVPVFVVSTDDTFDRQAQWKNIQSLGFVQKPVQFDTFKELLQNI